MDNRKAVVSVVLCLCGHMALAQSHRESMDKGTKLRSKDPLAAVAALNQALQLAKTPDEKAAAWYQMGYAYGRAQKLDESLGSYDKGSQTEGPLRGHKLMCTYYKAQGLARKKQHEEALQIYALVSGQGKSSKYVNLAHLASGQILLGLKRHEEARQAAQSALAAAKKYPFALDRANMLLGDVHLGLKDSAKALEAFQRVVDSAKCPIYIKRAAYLRMADSHMAAKDLASARKACQALLDEPKVRPYDMGFALSLLARIAEKEGKQDEAKAYHQKLIGLAGKGASASLVRSAKAALARLQKGSDKKP